MATGGSLPDEIANFDSEAQARLRGFLQAAATGRGGVNDPYAFADPDLIRRLTSSVSLALDDTTASNPPHYVKHRHGGGENETRSSSEPADGSESVEEGESLLSLACSAGYYELAQV